MDTVTGEILDIRSLSRPPQADRPRVKRYKAKYGHTVGHWAFVAAIATLGLWIAILGKLGDN